MFSSSSGGQQRLTGQLVDSVSLSLPGDWARRVVLRAADGATSGCRKLVGPTSHGELT
jgi:hypothetical protein